MKLEIGFGTISQQVEIPDKNVIAILEPNKVDVKGTGADEVLRAIRNPIGTGMLNTIIKPGEKIAIITSDITRPLPTCVIMPVLLEELYASGIKKEDITLVFALGSHRTHSLDEMNKLAGERVMNEIKCVDGDPNNFVRMGTTARGTPVNITRVVAEADRRICLGSIEYHYFAGYSGGAKAIMPGVSTRDAIQANHSKMVLPEAVAGRLEGNPVREDLEEAVLCCPIDFIVNVVLDEHKTIIYAAAGHYIKAHRAGCKFLDQLYLKEIERRADIVIVSQGGAPKDLNLYQTQKALDNAKHAVRKGGIIILVGSCKEGFGEDVFEAWMTQAPDAHSLIERIQKDFQLGGHKAAAIALVLEDADIYLVSELSPELVKSIFLKPYKNVQQALDAAFKKLGMDASVLIMPYGGSTLPRGLKQKRKNLQ
jgi:nickel-dependent lactate racemase